MEEIGEIGVDAGLCGIFTSKPDYSDNQWHSFCDMIGSKDFMLMQGEFDTVGVVSSSGYGDGGYPVYAFKDEGGDITAIEVVYICGEQENEEYV